MPQNFLPPLDFWPPIFYIHIDIILISISVLVVLMTNSPFSVEEKAIPRLPGMPVLLVNIILSVVAVLLIIFTASKMEAGAAFFPSGLILTIATVYLCLIFPIILAGLRVLKPNEALVLTLFGNYKGTLKGAGFFMVNPFTTPAAIRSLKTNTGTVSADTKSDVASALGIPGLSMHGSKQAKTVSLKAMTLSNDKQKVNDSLGNPIIIGIVVVWRVVNTARAIFNVDNYAEFLSIQCDSALRNIVRLYPYDLPEEEEGEKSLRGSSLEIAESLRQEIQEKVALAGLEILEARITHLSYAPEIAAAMLQRQQATAVIAARQKIVEGAVGMVEMALEKLKSGGFVDLDEERKAAMVSNLLVVLCGSKDAQPIINSGSIY